MPLHEFYCLRQRTLEVPFLPKPVLTRWSYWIEANFSHFYYYGYFKQIRDVMQQTILQSSHTEYVTLNSTPSIKK